MSESDREQSSLLSPLKVAEMQSELEVRVHELIEVQVRLTPQNVAISFEDCDLTYLELDGRANQLAHYLRSMGVGPGTCVAVLLERGLDLAVALLATLKAGGAYLPMDPMFPQDRLAFMISDAQVPVVLSQMSLMRNRNFGEARIVLLDRDAGDIVKESTEKPGEAAAPDDLAYLIYTSGSTGKPKGVEIEHHSVCNFLHSMRETPGLEQRDVLVAVTTVSFDIAALEIFLPLCVGARLVIASREIAADGIQLLSLLRSSKATVMQATPVTWKLLIEAGWDGNPHLKVLCGGEAFSRQLANELLARGSSVWNMYGPTETTIWSACARLEQSSGPVVIGAPIAETQIHLLDDNLHPVAPGASGELYIGGAGVARGYLNRPELTQQKFIPDPFSAVGARLYRTGDLARMLPNGDVEYLGRVDHQVKIHGHRIELGELESLIRSFEHIKDGVVVAREDVPGEKRLVAYIVPTDIERFDFTRLRNQLRKKLPEYMVPTSFVPLTSLPLTPNGKLDRKALPVPTNGNLQRARVHVSPHNDTQRELVSIWQNVLSVEKISINDSFFELGGNSLVAVRLFHEIEREFQIKLPLSTLIDAQTVEEVAEILSQQRHQAGQGWSSLVEIQTKGSRPPFFCIHGASGNVLIYRDLSRHLGPDQPFYGLQAQGLDGSVDRLATVEEMASLYILEIRRVQPKGPYLVGGYCLGGTIAYEIAQQLQDQGQKVALLALFDTLNWAKMSTASYWDRAYSQLQRLLFHGGNFSLLDSKNKRKFFKEKAEILRERSRLWRGILLRGVIGERRSFDSRSIIDAEIWKTNDLAKLSYLPKPYAGIITDFRPRKQYSVFDRPEMYWDDYALKGYEVVTLPVYPAGMLVEPFVEHLATALRKSIDRAIHQHAMR